MDFGARSGPLRIQDNSNALSGGSSPQGDAVREAHLTRARAFLDVLRRRMGKRLPGWVERGPQDPAVALLEVFAEALAEVQADVDELAERLYPRLLESLGSEPAWARAASGPVVFLPQLDAEASVCVPAGTVVSARRVPATAPLTFQTTGDAWVSGLPLERVVSLSADTHQEIVPYPREGWDGGARELFLRPQECSRYLLLGDPVLGFLRASRGTLVLEWNSQSPVLAEGAWEYSVRGGWRAARVDFEETHGAGGQSGLRVRLHGPLAGLREERIEGLQSPWLRVSLPAGKRLNLAQPEWVAIHLHREDPPAQLEFAATPQTAYLSSFPRPVARVLSSSAARCEDHSLSNERFQPVVASATWDPAVYFAWERPTNASIYFALQTHEAGEEQDDGEPRLVWEYSTARTFKRLQVEDGTAGLARSGHVSWRAPEPWRSQELFGERRCWVRARWTAAARCQVPVLRAVLSNAVTAIQGRTVENHVVEATLDASGAGIVSLQTAEGDVAPFHTVAVKSPGFEWRDVQDAQVQRLVTGNYRVHAGAESSGEVTIKIPDLRIGLGARGNVPAGRIEVLEGAVEGIEGISQPLAFEGGADGETAERYRARVRAEWQCGQRAVTPRDFERLCVALDSSVESVAVRWDPAAPYHVFVTVLGDGPFSRARLEFLQGRLAERTPLGTVVSVVEPLFLPVQILASPAGVATSSPEEGVRLPSEALHHLLEDGLREYFERRPRQGVEECPATIEWWRKEEEDALLRAAMQAVTQSLRGRGVGSGALMEGLPESWNVAGWRYRWAALDDSVDIDIEQEAFLAARTLLVMPLVEKLRFSGANTPKGTRSPQRDSPRQVDGDGGGR